MKEGRLMKKWKQILALTLAVVVTLSVVPVGDARAAVEEPTEYAIVGEIINADGAEITVKEISKDGTENVELPWEELEEDTQNSDTEKDKALSLELQTTACILYVWELDSTKGDI